MFKLLREVFSSSESMGANAQISCEHTILSDLCASLVMACHTRELRSARNASPSHKAKCTIKNLDLRENAIENDGANAIADAMKALLMMLCFLWNMTRY